MSWEKTYPIRSFYRIVQDRVQYVCFWAHGTVFARVQVFEGGRIVRIDGPEGVWALRRTHGR